MHAHSHPHRRPQSAEHATRRIALALAAVVVAGLALAAGAPPAGAQVDDDEPDNIVVLTGRAEVRPGDRVDTVFIADGPAVIEGTVRETVVALTGDVLVRGTVEENVVALDGRVVVGADGRVEGDVVSRRRPVVEQGGTVEGSWERWNPSDWNWAMTVAGRVAVWIAVTVSTLLLGLALGALAPRAADATDRVVAGGIWPVVGWGLLLAVGLPVIAVIAMATLVGLPLGLGVLMALGLVYGIAYVTAAWLLGRRVARRASRLLAFLAGWGILRLVALVPILGGLSWIAAVVVGLGALAVAGYQARSRPVVAPATGPAPPPPASAPA